MRETSTNVFNGGLNYDLNPLTTPNNVLTDCVNGTFITFNGDELALQNDAGNTKIAVPGSDPVEYVKLSTGFYPLGIKEYGGVLYIVSAKTPSTLYWEEWNSESTYVENAVVYKKDALDEYVYYVSTVNDNTEPVDNYYQWDELGSENDAINKLSEVEFGSYPSPEGADVREYPGIPREYNNTNYDLTNLYKKLVINDAIFKSSRYIIFDGVGSVDVDISRVSGIKSDNGDLSEEKLFYKPRLYHYLNNGYLDLTDSIQDRYQEYLEKNNILSGTHRWFTDDSFRYYCPTQYKGKLALSMEIEGLEAFHLFGYPGFSYDGTDYDFHLTVRAIGTDLILVPEARVEIWIDDVPYDFGGGVFYQDITITNNLGEFLLEGIPDADYDKEIRYRITPIIEVEGTKYAEGKYEDAYDDLPDEYISQYVIEGSRLIDTEYDDVYFENSEGACIGETTYKGYKLVTLKTLSGSLLDHQLNPTLIPHVFVDNTVWDSNYDTTNGTVTIATYGTSIPGDYSTIPKDVIVKKLDSYEALISMFKKHPIAHYSIDCDIQAVFTPKFIGVADGSDGSSGKKNTIYLLNDASQSKYYTVPEAIFADTRKGASSEIYPSRHCVDYDNSTAKKLVFVGEKNGWLSIVDITDPENILSKRIVITGDTTDLYTVKVVTSGTNAYGAEGGKEILIGALNRKNYSIPFKSNINSYISNDAHQIPNFPVGHEVTDFHYYGGYWAITGGSQFWNLTSAMGGTWERFNGGISVHRGYKIDEGHQYMYWSTVWSKGNREDERVMSAPKSDPRQFSDTDDMPGGADEDQRIVDLAMLDVDDLLLVDTRVGHGLWRLDGPTAQAEYITPTLFGDPGSYYNNTSKQVYTGGLCYDSTAKQAYIATSEFIGFNRHSKIMQYNAYGSGNLWATIEAPAFFYKLLLY